MIRRSAAGLAALCLTFAGCPRTSEGPGTTGGGTGVTQPTDAGCAVGTGGAASVTCESDAQCACPLTCGIEPTEISGDSSGQICLSSCESSSDCPDPRTHCVGGLCLVAICADGGPYDAACDSASNGDGTCLPSQTASGTPIGICEESGVATGSCDLVGSRTNPSGLCGVGSACLAFGSTGQCELACDAIDPDAGEGCGADAICLSPNGTAFGGCIALGPGGCLTMSPKPTELQVCSASSACECPQHCLMAPENGETICELSCSTTIDCPNVTTQCVGGACAPSYCAVNPLGDPVDGGLGEACTFLGGDDAGMGICTPMPSNESTPSGSPAFVYGVCVQSGTAPLGAACDVLAGRSQPSLLCVPGAYCAMVYESTGTFCAQACSAEAIPAEDGCPSGQGCFGIYRGMSPLLAPNLGLCRVCTASGQTCYGAAECCSGACADAGGLSDLCE